MSERVQKMARVNVDPDAWASLRVEALRRHTTLADLLGDLVERAASHSARPGPPTSSKAAPIQPQPAQATDWIPPWEE